jgi:hypothetical protein
VGRGGRSRRAGGRDRVREQATGAATTLTTSVGGRRQSATEQRAAGIRDFGKTTSLTALRSWRRRCGGAPAVRRVPQPHAMARRVGAALAVSAAATAGTAYYMLSDGGDAALAQRRVDTVLARLRPVAPAVAPGAAGAAAAAARPGTSAADAKLASATAPAAGTGAAAPAAASAAQRPRGAASPFPPRSQAGEGEAHGACHTCSGPRLWFYADKLGVTRLRRRFGPQPDP